MFQTTRVTCPLCGEFGDFVHTFRSKPVFGGCEKCGFDHVPGFTGRGMIEHRRPKLVPDWEFYAPTD